MRKKQRRHAFERWQTGKHNHAFRNSIHLLQIMSGREMTYRLLGKLQGERKVSANKSKQTDCHLPTEKVPRLPCLDVMCGVQASYLNVCVRVLGRGPP